MFDSFILESRSVTEFPSTALIKVMLITSTNYAKASEQISTSQEIVNSLQMENLNLAKIHIETVPA